MGITLSLEDVRARQEELRQELAELEAVERYILRREGKPLRRVRLSAKTRNPATNQGPSLVDAIRDAVRDRGPISSAKVIRDVHRVLPGAQPSSIRSTCSVLSQKGEFKRVGDKWAIADQKKEDGQPKNEPPPAVEASGG